MKHTGQKLSQNINFPPCPCRPRGSVEGRLHSVHERKIRCRVQTEDGQIRPDLWLQPVTSPRPRTASVLTLIYVSAVNKCSPPAKTHAPVSPFSQPVWSLMLQSDSGIKSLRNFPSQSIFKPNLPQPLPPQYVQTATYVMCIYWPGSDQFKNATWQNCADICGGDTLKITFKIFLLKGKVTAFLEWFSFHGCLKDMCWRCARYVA